jgi:hypothetical protein
MMGQKVKFKVIEIDDAANLTVEWDGLTKSFMNINKYPNTTDLIKELRDFANRIEEMARKKDNLPPVRNEVTGSEIE